MRTTWLFAAVNRTLRNELFSLAASLISMMRGSSMVGLLCETKDVDAARDRTECDGRVNRGATPHMHVDFRPGAGSSRHFSPRPSRPRLVQQEDTGGDSVLASSVR